MKTISHIGLALFCGCLTVACGGGGSATTTSTTTSFMVPVAPMVGAATVGDASVKVAFTASTSDGGAAITGYTAICATAGGTSKTGTGTTSPITVSSLINGVLYSCTVTAANAVGSSVASGAVTVTPIAGTTGSSLNAAYKNVAWQKGVTVTFPTDCTMTYTSKGMPSHSTDAYYLEPVRDVGGAVVATTAVSKMQLGTAAFGGASFTSTPSMSQTFNTCPVKATTATATSGGAIGWMISGSSLFNATEGDNNPTPALTDNVSYSFTDSGGVSRTASFIDSCNGHPTPVMNTYHYHALPSCVTALVDTTAGASHIIGIANDGFPIYGNKDIAGAAIGISQLDTCNGITSATPEFPNGVYHYVLPDGVTSLRSSIGCYTGTVSKPQIAAAAIANGICYGLRTEL